MKEFTWLKKNTKNIKMLQLYNDSNLLRRLIINSDSQVIGAIKLFFITQTTQLQICF